MPFLFLNIVYSTRDHSFFFFFFTLSVTLLVTSWLTVRNNTGLGIRPPRFLPYPFFFSNAGRVMVFVPPYIVFKCLKFTNIKSTCIVLYYLYLKARVSTAKGARIMSLCKGY